MSNRWYALRIYPDQVSAHEIGYVAAAELLDAGQPVFLGTRADLQRLAVRQGKSLRVRPPSHTDQQGHLEPSETAVPDFLSAADEAACTLFAAGAVAW